MTPNDAIFPMSFSYFPHILACSNPYIAPCWWPLCVSMKRAHISHFTLKNVNSWEFRIWVLVSYEIICVRFCSFVSNGTRMERIVHRLSRGDRLRSANQNSNQLACTALCAKSWRLHPDFQFPRQSIPQRIDSLIPGDENVKSQPQESTPHPERFTDSVLHPFNSPEWCLNE